MLKQLNQIMPQLLTVFCYVLTVSYRYSSLIVGIFETEVHLLKNSTKPERSTPQKELDIKLCSMHTILH